jgi:hypothetical protein
MGPHPSARRHRVVVKTFADLKSAAASVKAAPVIPVRVTAKLPPPAAEQPAKPTAPTAKQRKRHHARILASEWLRQTYPALFGWPPRPLMVGIGLPIVEAGQAAGFKRAHIGRARWFHVSRGRYLEALAAEGAMRHGLDGEPVEPVSEGDRV